jgi:hypothetical protein
MTEALEEALEVVCTYGFFLVFYPYVLFESAVETPGLFLGWVVVGGVVFELLRRFAGAAPTKLWVALWFLPGTLICGAAAIAPWPAVALRALAGVPCGNILSLTLCLSLNVCLVFGVARIARRFWRRRAAVSPPVGAGRDR